MIPLSGPVLVFGAHFDDAFLGAGGYTAKLHQNNRRIVYVVFSGNGDHPCSLKSRNNQFHLACESLGVEDYYTYDLPLHKLPEHNYEIREIMGRLQRELHPGLVLVPSLHDSHQDHKAVAWEAVRTFRSQETILGYELPRHGSIFFHPNLFVDITQFIDLKVKALMCYKTELERHPSYFNQQVFKSMAQMRGNQVGIQYGEAYEAIKIYV